MSTTAFEHLIRASHRALAGPNPADAWLLYGVPIEDAAVFVQGWTEELRRKAIELDIDTTDPEFVHHLVLGALQVGIEFGRTLDPHSDTDGR